MRTDASIPWALQELVDRELEPHERVEWIETPTPRFFSPASTSLFLFSIPWTAFAVFWICGAAGFKVPAFNQGANLFPLFGVPFVLIGLGMLSSPLWMYRKTSKTVYAITDQRAITIEGGWRTTIRSFPPDKLHEVFRREGRNGMGDVIFSRREWRDSDSGCHVTELGFFHIRDPQAVERMLKKLAEQDVADVERSGR